jgi:hypothetical protein
MAIGLVVSAAMNVLFGLSSGLTALATFWLVNNWAQGMGFPPCARNMGYWFAPEERSTSFGVWHTGHMIGAALVSVLTGYLVTHGWRLCFFVPAGLAVGGVVLILNRLRDTPGSLGLPVYFFILITHIVLSAVVVPMILLSFFLALSGRLVAHRRLSRYTFPVWLYVSVTGVLVFVMLKAFAR